MTDTLRRIPYVTREVVQQAKAALQRIAETRNPNAAIPQRISRPSVVRALRGEIATMFKQGYELEDVTAVLIDHGVDIDPQAFREYWRAVRRRTNRKPTPKPVRTEVKSDRKTGADGL